MKRFMGAAIVALLTGTLATAALANQVANPGFENGALDPWQIWGNMTITNDAATGQAAATATAYSGGGLFFDVQEGVDYTWSAVGKSVGGIGWAGIRYRFYDAGWVPVADYVRLPGFGPTFEARSETFTAPAGVARVQLSIWNTSSGIVVVDDVSFTNGSGSGSGGNGGGNQGDNLMINAGFEDGSTAPWQLWGSFSAVNDGSARSGVFVARIPPYNGGGTIIDVTAGEQYRFSAYGVVGGAGGGAQLQLKFFNAAWEEIDPPLMSNAFGFDNYSERDIVANAPSSAVRAQLAIWNGNANDLLVDDLRFELADGSGNSGGNNGSNLAINGDFESGSLSPWQDWGGLTVTNGNGAHTGEWYGRIAPASGGGLIIDVSGGETYQWSGWGRMTGPGSGQLFYKFFDAGWAVLGTPQYADGFAAGWEQRSGSTLAPPTAVYLQIGVWNASQSEMRIDEISVTAGEDGGGSNGNTDPTNLIANAGFEGGEVSPWEGWSSLAAVEVTDAYNGNWVARTPPGNGGGVAAEVVTGRSYTYSGFGRSTGNSGWAGLQYRYFDSNWTPIGQIERSAGFSPDWSLNAVTTIAPAGAARIQVSVWNGSDGMLEVDELSLRIDGSGNSSGVMYYVAPDGAGVSTIRSAPGDVSATIAKICDASLNSIQPGDTVNFLDGVYLTSTFQMSYSADAGQAGHGGRGVTMLARNCGGPQYVYLQSENRHGAIIRNDVTTQNHSGGFDLRRSSYISIDGFVVDGVNTANVPFERGISIEDSSHHIKVTNNRLLNIGGGGINVTDSSHLRIEGNEIRNAAGQHPYCGSAINLYQLTNPQTDPDNADGYSNYIIGNRVFNTATRPDCDANADLSDGIESHDGNCVVLDLLNQTQYTANRTLIENNLCVANDGGGIHLFESGNVDVFNNTVFATGREHFEGGLGVVCTTWPTENVRFANNLVHAFAPTGAFNSHVLVATDFGLGCLGNIEHRHNIFVNRDPVPSDIQSVAINLTTDPADLADCNSDANLIGVATTDMGVINAAVDPAQANFSLADGTSLPVDLGSCVLTPQSATDLSGLSRLQGARHDVGAYERP